VESKTANQRGHEYKSLCCHMGLNASMKIKLQILAHQYDQSPEHQPYL